MFSDLNKLLTDLARHLLFRAVDLCLSRFPPTYFLFFSLLHEPSCGETHVNVLQGENHRLVNEYTARLLVDRSCNDVRVDSHRHVATIRLICHLDGGVFRTEELA